MIRFSKSPLRETAAGFLSFGSPASVARIEQSEIRSKGRKSIPAFAALKPGYDFCLRFLRSSQAKRYAQAACALPILDDFFPSAVHKIAQAAMFAGASVIVLRARRANDLNLK